MRNRCGWRNGILEDVIFMIQDIFPSRLYNEFKNCKMKEGDSLLIFDGDGRILLGDKDGKIVFPKAGELKDENALYLFSLDDEKCFLSMKELSEKGKKDFLAEKGEKADFIFGKGKVEGFSFYEIREARDRFSGKEIYAVFTGFHLWKWYRDNRFCGRCGEGLEPAENERALRCPKCGNVIYPRINPAVIVGVINRDKILITKYKRGYAHNALVAGFTEIGETVEETVEREVMEETGLKVKNVTYYKSQPWGMAQDILMGFYCELDGDERIQMDESELKYAEWVERGDVVLQPNNLSLTNEMMRVFKDGGEIL